jgi:outer membrane lipoprotein SlyB
MKKLIHTAVLASVAAVGFAATPALARDSYNYGARNDTYRVGDTYRGRDYDNRRYDNRRYDDRSYGYDRRYARNYQQCRRNSGTTGTILGAIAGGLLGREIGRGGYRNQPSTTGLILGAGAGALAGRAIDKSSSCDRNYRR